jgi:hypothetical protein
MSYPVGGFMCKVAAAGRTDPPQECSWPFCGCDTKATEVIEALVEMGWGSEETQHLLRAKAEREATEFRECLVLLNELTNPFIGVSPTELQRARVKAQKLLYREGAVGDLTAALDATASDRERLDEREAEEEASFTKESEPGTDDDFDTDNGDAP